MGGLLGTIGLRLDTAWSVRRLLIRDGRIAEAASIPEAPPQGLIYENFRRPAGVTPPAGYYLAGPYLRSPDGKLLAASLGRDQAGDAYQARAVAIIGVEDGRVLAIRDGGGDWGVQALAWSPDSRYLAVVRSTGEYGLCLVEILSYLSSHPVTLSSYTLDVVGLDGRVVAGRDLMSRVHNGRAEVV